MGIFRKLAMAGAVLTAVAVSVPANAATWSITTVQNGSWNGFGASGFHETGGSSDSDHNVMTGSSLGDINVVLLNGVFNDVDGTFFGEFGLAGSTGTFTLTSFDLVFGSPSGTVGFLDGPSHMALDVTGLGSSGLTSTNIGFHGMDVCCNGGANDPNSFNILSGSGGTTAIMALWGANGFFDTGYSGYDENTGEAIAESTIGLDLRLLLTKNPQVLPEVPIPASLPLFGTGLALMGYLGWRKKKRKA